MSGDSQTSKPEGKTALSTKNAGTRLNIKEQWFTILTSVISGLLIGGSWLLSQHVTINRLVRVAQPN